MDAKAEFQRLFDAYVERYMAGDAAACSAFYARNAEIHSPFGPPASGRDTLVALHREWFTEGEINKTITILDAHAEGAIGYALARYAADIPQEDGNMLHDSGTSLNTFQRQDNGAWLIHYTSLNATPD